MSEFGGSWKQNKPAYTKMLKLDTLRKKKTSASRDLGVAMATFRIMQASRCLIGASQLSRGTTESEVHSVSDVTLSFVAFRLSITMCYMA